MKKNRLKQCKKLVAIYKRMFNYHSPFLVLVDETFCKAAAAQNIFDLRDRISNYLTTKSTCCTTVCILNELKVCIEYYLFNTLNLFEFLHKCINFFFKIKNIISIICFSFFSRDNLKKLI